MPKVSEVYAGEFLVASQFTEQHVPAVITAVAAEQVGNSRTVKLVLDLGTPDGAPWERRLVVNKRNSLILASAYGDDTDAWVHRMIELWSEPTTFEDKPTMSIMVAPASNSGGKAIAIPAPKRSGGDLDDVIPWTS